LKTEEVWQTARREGDQGGEGVTYFRPVGKGGPRKGILRHNTTARGMGLIKSRKYRRVRHVSQTGTEGSQTIKRIDGLRETAKWGDYPRPGTALVRFQTPLKLSEQKGAAKKKQLLGGTRKGLPS